MNKNLLNKKTVVIASYNSGKILEFKTLLSKYNVNVITASDINASDVEEVGKTFKFIAISLTVVLNVIVFTWFFFFSGLSK